VKERWSYRCTKWWIRRRRSDGWRNRWVGNGGAGARMMFTVLFYLRCIHIEKPFQY